MYMVDYKVVSRWLDAGDNLTGRRIMAMFGKDMMPYTPSRLGQMQALLMKFSPIWHETQMDNECTHHDYIYADGSYIHIRQNHESLRTRLPADIYYFSCSQIDAIYHSLVELGLISTEVQHVC